MSLPSIAKLRRLVCIVPFPFLGLPSLGAAQLQRTALSFLENHCLDCHDSSERKGDLDLENLGFDLSQPDVFSQWVEIHDRAQSGEMPPKKKKRPDSRSLERFSKTISRSLVKADNERVAQNGRSKVRRLNRFEYENTLKRVLDAPWIQIAERLPEDGTAYLYNKASPGQALDFVA